MYCPECGTESSGQRFCRTCGANLKVISKAVAVGQAIARGDGGRLPKFKELMESPNIKRATEQVSQALEQMSNDFSKGLANAPQHEPWWMHYKDQRTPEQRRDDHLVKGSISLFVGIGIMIFLYFVAGALKIPPEKLTQIPFDLAALLKVVWLFGLLPALAGFGQIVAGLLIKGTRPDALKETQSRNVIEESPGQPSFTSKLAEELPASVVERTTRSLGNRTRLPRSDSGN